jgi:hypothetical protein
LADQMVAAGQEPGCKSDEDENSRHEHSQPSQPRRQENLTIHFSQIDSLWTFNSQILNSAPLNCVRDNEVAWCCFHRYFCSVFPMLRWPIVMCINALYEFTDTLSTCVFKYLILKVWARGNRFVTSMYVLGGPPT